MPSSSAEYEYQYVLCETIVGEVPKVTASRYGILAHVLKCYSLLILEEREDPEIVKGRAHLIVYQKETQQWMAGWKSVRRLLGWAETGPTTVSKDMLDQLSKRFDIYIGVGINVEFDFRPNELLLCRVGRVGVGAAQEEKQASKTPTADPEMNLQVTHVSVQENDAVIRWRHLIETRPKADFTDVESVVGAHATHVPGDCDTPVPKPLVQQVVNTCRHWMNDTQVVWNLAESTIEEANPELQRRFARGRGRGHPGDPLVRMQWTAHLLLPSSDKGEDEAKSTTSPVANKRIVSARLFYWDSNRHKTVAALEIQYGTNKIGHLLASLSDIPGTTTSTTIETTKGSEQSKQQMDTGVVPPAEASSSTIDNDPHSDSPAVTNDEKKRNPGLWKATGRKIKQYKVGKDVLSGIRDVVDSAKETVTNAASLLGGPAVTKGDNSDSQQETMASTTTTTTTNFGLVCGHDEDHPFCESNTFAYVSSDGCAGDTSIDKSQPITPERVLRKLIEETTGYCLDDDEELDE